MRGLAGGFLPFHYRLVVAGQAFESTKKALEARGKSWKRAGQLPDGLAGFEAYMRGLPDFRQLIEVGPQSSLLIPLRMVKGLVPGADVTLRAAVGTGPVADALAAGLREQGVDLVGFTKQQDSPVEVHLEAGVKHQTLRLRCWSRASERFKSTVPEPLPDLFLLNRDNQGLRDVARAVAANGGTVVLRPRAFGRYDNPGDLAVELLPHCHGLMLSSRDNALKDLAKAVGVQAPGKRGTREAWQSMAAALLPTLSGRMAGGTGTVWLHDAVTQGAWGPNADGAVACVMPGEPVNGSLAGRLQGALAAQLVGRPVNEATPLEQGMRDAMDGVGPIPWGFPLIDNRARARRSR